MWGGGRVLALYSHIAKVSSQIAMNRAMEMNHQAIGCPLSLMGRALMDALMPPDSSRREAAGEAGRLPRIPVRRCPGVYTTMSER